MLGNLLISGKGPQFAKLPYQIIRCYSKKSASSNKWLQRASNDHYTKAAKFAQYKSRAAFKLIQLDKQFKLLKPGLAVVDLGFAPGAWTQVAVEKTKPNGRILGVDIIPAPPPKGASAMQANILSMRTHQLIRQFFNETHSSKLGDDDVLDKPSYIQSEMTEIKQEELVETRELVQFPLDLVISDMYAPICPPERYWNNTTNSAYDRMANTSGVAVKDHSASIDLCDAALILAIDLLKPGGNFVCKFFTGAEDAGLEKRIGRVFKRVVRWKPEASRSESKESYFIGQQKKKNVDKVEVFS